MKREQVIELARKSGFVISRNEYVFNEMLDEFACLVELATLERAAQACEQSEAYRGSMFAQRIRALKPVTDNSGNQNES